MIKSPLRYPGGKSRAVNKILPLFPAGITKVLSPFLGGGSIELALASNEVNVIASDKFYPLINFWYYLQYHHIRLANTIKKFYPLSKEGFYEFQQLFIEKASQHDTLDLNTAALFYVLNRSSFDGTTMSGGCSNPSNRFTLNSIQYVNSWQRLTSLELTCLDFNEFLAIYQDDFIFADPPYMIASNLYGSKGSHHKDFDHQGLFNILSKREGWILCYNDCPEIRELYQDFKFVEPEWSYGMGKVKKSRELLILNF